MTTLLEPTNDPLARFKDGARIEGTGVPMPLVNTMIDVRVLGGLAIVRTERTFHNVESHSIEATITFPVPLHATMVALTASIDDRRLTGKAQRKQSARAAYEAAIDDGKTAVLHEEALRGIYILSVGHIPPGKDIKVTSVWAMPLSRQGDLSMVRIPVTVGDIYGRSPLADSDDLTHGPEVHGASLTVSSDAGSAQVRGVTLIDGAAHITLDRPIDVLVPNWRPRDLHGVSADGRRVTLQILPSAITDAVLNADWLLDQSGSMDDPAVGETVLDGTPGTPSKHDVMVRGMRRAVEERRRGDRIRLWQFDTACEPVGSLDELWEPRGGTEIGAALAKVAEHSEAVDIAIVTDGKSHNIDVQGLARTGKRFTVILIGEDSLEAHIGQLAALTGGQLFVVPGTAADEAILAAIDSMRHRHLPVAPIEGAPLSVAARIGGMEITARWGEPVGSREEAVIGSEDCRFIGAVAAGLAIPHMAEEAAACFAEQHGIVCHLTSLVLVDEAGEAQDGLPVQRKVPLTSPARNRMMAGRQTVLSDTFQGDAYAASWGGLRENVVKPGLRLAGLRNLAGQGQCEQSGFSLETLVGWIDWSEAEALRRGDIAALPVAVRGQVKTLARLSAVTKLAKVLGISAVAVVIALLAGASANRNAARVFRAVLGKADAAIVKAAAQAVGL